MKFHYQPPRPKRPPLREVLAAGFIPIRHEVARLLIKAADPSVEIMPDWDIVSPERFAQILEEARQACPAPVDPVVWMIEVSEAVVREFQKAAVNPR